jgi:hypothetical protein
MTDILAAIDDPALLGASIHNPASWRPWRALLGAAFGLGIRCRLNEICSAYARTII